VEGGGAAVSCDEEGRRGVGWHAIKPPIVAAIEEEGSSKVTPPCKRERVVVAALNLGEIETNGRESHMCCCSRCVREKERER
jgi:hypothetical protein